MTVEIDSVGPERFDDDLGERRLRSSVDRLKNAVTSLEELVRVAADRRDQAMTNPEDGYPKTGETFEMRQLGLFYEEFKRCCSSWRRALKVFRDINDRYIRTPSSSIAEDLVITEQTLEKVAFAAAQLNILTN